MSQEMYGSEPEVFAGIKEVNEWVEKATNGQVTDFLTSLPPNLVLMLLNAVHYKGKQNTEHPWQTLSMLNSHSIIEVFLICDVFVFLTFWAFEGWLQSDLRVLSNLHLSLRKVADTFWSPTYRQWSFLHWQQAYCERRNDGWTQIPPATSHS